MSCRCFCLLVELLRAVSCFLKVNSLIKLQCSSHPSRLKCTKDSGCITGRSNKSHSPESLKGLNLTQTNFNMCIYGTLTSKQFLHRGKSKTRGSEATGWRYADPLVSSWWAHMTIAGFACELEVTAWSLFTLLLPQGLLALHRRHRGTIPAVISPGKNKCWCELHFFLSSCVKVLMFNRI